jgi:uncharacterized protein (TIGR02284 family)
MDQFNSSSNATHTPSMQSHQMDSTTNDAVVMALKNLSEINHVGAEGYNTAADNIKNSEYSAMFRGFSSQRATFELELNQHIQRMGGTTNNSSPGEMLENAAGALHRGWINLKSMVTGGGIEAMLDECERGDEAAVKAYQEALEVALPQDVAEVVRQQYHSVQEAYTRVKGLARIEA